MTLLQQHRVFGAHEGAHQDAHVGVVRTGPVLRVNDSVRLLRDVSRWDPARWGGVRSDDLCAGAIGTVVMVYEIIKPEPQYEVEFTDRTGARIGMVTLPGADIEHRPE